MNSQHQPRGSGQSQARDDPANEQFHERRSAPVPSPRSIINESRATASGSGRWEREGQLCVLWNAKKKMARVSDPNA